MPFLKRVLNREKVLPPGTTISGSENSAIAPQLTSSDGLRARPSVSESPSRERPTEDDPLQWGCVHLPEGRCRTISWALLPKMSRAQLHKRLTSTTTFTKRRSYSVRERRAGVLEAVLRSDRHRPHHRANFRRKLATPYRHLSKMRLALVYCRRSVLLQPSDRRRAHRLTNGQRSASRVV